MGGDESFEAWICFWVCDLPGKAAEYHAEEDDGN
jgi:hypothetical protein